MKNGQPDNVPIYIKQLGFSQLLPISSGKKRVRKRERSTLQSRRIILLSIKQSVISKLKTPHLLQTPRTYYVYTPYVPCVGGVDKTVDKYVRLDMNYTLPNILILLTLM